MNNAQTSFYDGLSVYGFTPVTPPPQAPLSTTHEAFVTYHAVV